ncbi:MAG: ABC transporter permease [Caldiserica bacterium]|nr:MAG: ABC transporter permease [Caldisericota bacterium]
MKRINFLEFLPVIFLIVIWEIAGRLRFISKELFPPFTEVLSEFFLLIKNGILLENFFRSLIRVLAGFTMGSVLGIFAGILMGWNKYLGKALSPVVSILYPIPALGWLPILMLWIGINELLPIVIIFICSFFPLCYNTVCGIRNVDKDYIHVAQTLGASKIEILKHIVIPLALPNIFTGLRLEAGMAWRVIIAAEMVAIPTGIGALMMRAESLIRMDIIIVCLLVLAVMTFLFERIFIWLENKTIKWRT